MRIYVGNLPYGTTEDELRREFEAFGKVESLSIITDEQTGRSKGFGFVEMPSNSEAEAAILGLHGKTIEGRNLTVNEARPRPEAGAGTYERRGGSRGGGGRDGGGRREKRY